MGPNIDATMGAATPGRVFGNLRDLAAALMLDISIQRRDGELKPDPRAYLSGPLDYTKSSHFWYRSASGSPPTAPLPRLSSKNPDRADGANLL